jgi:RNA polymerase sigma-70 factor (ECF subfamily)
MRRPDTIGETSNGSAVFSEAAIAQLDALYGYALTLTRDRTEAEDLVQETYLRAVGAFGQLVPNSNLKGWLFVIMRNVWLNQLRHAKSGPLFVELKGESESLAFQSERSSEDPYLVYLRKLERAEIQAAIADLPDLYREIVVLRDIEGFSYQEISAILSCPTGTVMSRLGRAREKLRRTLLGWQRATAAKAV